MAGPLDIQRVPRGLLDALSMKGSGRAPQQLAPDVRAVLKTDWMYYADKREQLSVAGPINTVGLYNYANGARVPAGEIWAINAIAWRNVIDAVGQITAMPGYSSQQSSIVHYLAPTAEQINEAAGTARTTHWGQRYAVGELILPAGWTIGLAVQSLTASVVQTLYLDIYRFLV